MFRYIVAFLFVCTVVAYSPVQAQARVLDGRAILHQKSNGNMCAVTFDDGPSQHTAQLLDSLNAEGIKATFFVLGRQVLRHPELIQRMLQEGHEVGSHSYSHPNFRKLSSSAQYEQLAETNRLLRELGANPRSFRPPYGIFTDHTVDLALELGMSIVLWSSDSMDWKRRPADYSQMRTITGRPALPGKMHGIFLFHDTRLGTVEDLPLIVATLRAGGCEKFVTVQEYMDYDFTEPPMYTQLPAGPLAPGQEPVDTNVSAPAMQEARMAVQEGTGMQDENGESGLDESGPDGSLRADSAKLAGQPSADSVSAAGDVPPLARSSQPWPWTLFKRSGT